MVKGDVPWEGAPGGADPVEGFAAAAHSVEEEEAERLVSGVEEVAERCGGGGGRYGVGRGCGGRSRCGGREARGGGASKGGRRSRCGRTRRIIPVS